MDETTAFRVKKLKNIWKPAALLLPTLCMSEALHVESNVVASLFLVKV